MKTNASLSIYIHLKCRELFANEKYIEKKFKDIVFCYKSVEESLIWVTESGCWDKEP